MTPRPSASDLTVADVLVWLGDDETNVQELLHWWNEGCQDVFGEGIVEFIVGGLVTGELAEAATYAAEYA